MVALSGAVRWRGDGGRLDLTGVQRILAPYGSAHTWSGVAGPCTVAVGGQAPDARGGPRPAMAEGLDGTVVWVDAHLHRRHDLIQRLGLPPGSTDAQLVLAAYGRWGRAFLQQLSGSFALAVVDRRAGGVLLARDHAGARFLAFHEGDGVLAFASTALALTGFDGVGHDLDPQRAVEVILLGHAGERTFVRGVRSLQAGEAAWVDGRGLRRWRWWLDQELPIVDAGSLEAHGIALRRCLEDAVESSLTDAGQVGVLLSGGLDSTSIAAVAAQRLAPAALRSYTSVPPQGWEGPMPTGWIPTERSAVEALAAQIPNLVPSFVDVPVGSLFDHCEPLWELGSPPVRNPMNMIWVFACYELAATSGVDVMLTGSGGNFAFSADGPRWLVELARRGRLLEVAREATTFARAFDTTVVKILRRDLLAHLLPGLKRRREVRGGADPLAAWVGASAILPERLAAVDLGAILPELVDPHPKGSLRDTRRMFQGLAALAEHDAAVQVRWGIEPRDPTNDRQLVELAVTQPEWWRRHRGEWRAICRAAMRDTLPAEIVDRPTLGAQQPEWFDRLTAARPEILDELDAMRDHPPSCEVIDVARLDRLARTWPDRSRAGSPQVINDYQLALSRGLFLSRYLRWFDAHGRRPGAGGPAVAAPPAP